MGEIGYDMNAFLYSLKWWQVIAISRGYLRRSRTQCDMTRWAVFSLMNLFVDLGEKGIDSPDRLLRFPWDGDSDKGCDLPSDDEVKETIEMLQALNRKAKEKTQVNP